MNRNHWHLDIQYDDSLFSRNWDALSHGQLKSIFAHLDSTADPVLSMLPPGVSPAGAAAAASFYFLPGIQSPPKPHCRIAVFPGLHFVRQLGGISFLPSDLYRATQKARALQRGYGRVEGALDKLRHKYKETDPILFHWIFKCQRSWTRYRQKESIELLPRAYFGRNDPYSPIIDFIESEHLEIFSSKFEPYDLLIYCPYFHSRSVAQTEEDLDSIVSKISKFSAHRKLIVARSPFDYWSRRLELKIGTKGIALASHEVEKEKLSGHRSSIQFTIVDQLIDLSEAKSLFDGVKKCGRASEGNRQIVNEIKFLLRRLLVSLDPKQREGEESPQELASRLESLSSVVGLDKIENAWAAIQKIKMKAGAPGIATKLDLLRQLISQQPVEIWVTKDLDREILLELKQKHGLDVIIRLADRWMAPGVRETNRPVILSRIDREGDLDLTAYLKGGDFIVMSAWEAVVRGASIMSSWERSERWRDQATKLGINSSSNGLKYADPVLDLANYLDSAAVNHLAVKSPYAPETTSEQEDQNWWDDHDASSILDTELDRTQLLASTGGTTYVCCELRFDGELGMFVRQDSEIQVISDESDGDIIAVPTGELEPNMMVILFKDSERNSIFYILMDQLERSPEHQQDARVVRSWKEKIREHVTRKALSISAIAANLASRGRPFDNITIRSWIFGSTMAPMKQEHLDLFVASVEIQNINTKQLFNSVKNLRNIARTLGKALNDVIVNKEFDHLDPGVRAALLNAGIDLDELSGAIETRKLIEVGSTTVEIEGKNIRKLFKSREPDN